MKFSLPFRVSAAALALAASPSHAAIIIDIIQVDNDVVATGSGTFNTFGLATNATFPGLNGAIRADHAIIRVGTGSETLYQFLSGPGSFGTSDSILSATSSSGDIFGLNGSSGIMFLPTNYVSGSMLNGSSTFGGQSLSSLALISGSYVFSSPFDTVTVNIRSALSAVPEPSTWLMIIAGFGLVGASLRSRVRKPRVSFA